MCYLVFCPRFIHLKLRKRSSSGFPRESENEEMEEIMEPPPFPTGNLLEEVMAELEEIAASDPLADMKASNVKEQNPPEQSFAEDFDVDSDSFIVFDSSKMEAKRDIVETAIGERPERREGPPRFWNAQRGDNLLNLAFKHGVKCIEKGEEITLSTAATGAENAPIPVDDDDGQEKESPDVTHTSPKVILKENRFLSDAERWMNLACRGLHKNASMCGPFGQLEQKVEAGEIGEPFQWDRMTQTLMPRDFRLPEASRDYSMTSDNLVKHLFHQKVLKRWNVRSQWDKDMERLGLQFFRMATLQSVAMEGFMKIFEKLAEKVKSSKVVKTENGEEEDEEDLVADAKKILGDLESLVAFGVNRSVVLKSVTNRKSRSLFLDSVKMPQKLKNGLLDAPCLSYDLFSDLNGIVGDYYKKPPTRLPKGMFDLDEADMPPPLPKPMLAPLPPPPPPQMSRGPMPPAPRGGPPPSGPPRGGRGGSMAPRGGQGRPRPLMQSPVLAPVEPSRGGGRPARGRGGPPSGPRGGGSRGGGPQSRGGGGRGRGGPSGRGASLGNAKFGPDRQNTRGRGGGRDNGGGTWKTFSGDSLAPSGDGQWSDGPGGSGSQWNGNRGFGPGGGNGPSWNDQGPSNYGGDQNSDNWGPDGQKIGGSNQWNNQGGWGNDSFSQNDSSNNFNGGNFQRGGVEWRPLPPPPPPPPPGPPGGLKKPLLSDQFGPTGGPPRATVGFGGNSIADDRGMKRKNEFGDGPAAFHGSQGPNMQQGRQRQGPFAGAAPMGQFFNQGGNY